MARFRGEFDTYSTAKAEYNLLKSRYNTSLRLYYTNWVNTLFGIQEGQLFSFGALNAIFPNAEKIGATNYARPVYPFNIYNPSAYVGVNLDEITYEEISFGFGKPMASMYTLEEGGGEATNPGHIGKNYKNFGIMGVLQMTTEQSTKLGNYNKAIT